MKITFLEAEVPLTKTFNLENGEITKVGHPKIIDYTSHQYDATDLASFAENMKSHAARGHCLLKGNVTRPLTCESRAGTTSATEPTRWLCLDLDGLKHIGTVDEFMASVGMPDVSYIVQYSSSMGVLPGRGLSAHVFVLLDREHLPDALKQWLKHKNFSVPGLRAGLSLTRTGNALRWTLDVSTCQNDKLIYIAPPQLGPGVTDSFQGERIQLVAKARHEAVLDASGVSAEVNKLQEQKVLDALRAEKGLEKKAWDRSKTVHGVTYMPKPDSATLTGIKEERGFIYLNLNGGDSWGYYHSKDNPNFVHNFKGEPVYKTSELLPEYWAGLQRAKRAELRQDGLMYLAFVDFESGSYWRGTYDEAEGKLDLAMAKGEQQVRDWLVENGQPQPEVLPTFRTAYEPTNTRRVDLQNKWVNTYQPSAYERRYEDAPEKVDELPELSRRVMLHMLGNDEQTLEHLVNWLACKVQYKTRTETAWVWQGVQGTGKGVVFNYLLRPMFGDSNVTEKRMEEFESEFNGFLDGKLLVLVDDGSMEDHRKGKVLASAFKNYITEPRISLRAMHRGHRLVPNHLSYILTSNKNAAEIEDSDRRYNVAPFQNAKLEVTPQEVEQLETTDSWRLYCHLRGYKADAQRARKALANAAKADLAERTRDSIDAACNALKAGDYQFFLDNVRTDLSNCTRREEEAFVAYKALVESMRAWDCISRDEVGTLLNGLVGNMPTATMKLTKLLAHRHVNLVPCRRGKDVFKGVKVRWISSEPGSTSAA